MNAPRYATARCPSVSPQYLKPAGNVKCERLAAGGARRATSADNPFMGGRGLPEALISMRADRRLGERSPRPYQTQCDVSVDVASRGNLRTVRYDWFT